MITKQLDRLLLYIDDFPKSIEDNNVKLFKSKEEHLKTVLYKELELVCGASKNESQLVSEISVGFEKIVYDLVTGKDAENALIAYTNIENRIEKEVSSNLYLFAKQSLISVKALYYYKKKNWDKALAITLECNALNDYLVQQGVHALMPRVLEQNKNIASIFLREKKFDSAYSLLFNLFNYLFNGTNKNLYGNSLNSILIWKNTEMLREVYINQMFMAIVADSVRFNFYNKDCYLPSKWYLNLKFKVNNTNRKIISDWIHINLKLRENNIEEFIKSLINFLSEPISSHYDILKIALIIELNKLMQKSSYSKKELLFDKISFYLKEKLTGHSRIREIMIKRLNKQVAA